MLGIVFAAMPGLDVLDSIMWQFLTFLILIVAVVVFLLYRYVIEPPIARQMTKAKWSKGMPMFIENENGTVEFSTSDKSLPEGLKYVKGKGWFANAIRDVLEVTEDPSEDLKPIEGEKRGPGRPPKESDKEGEKELTKEEVAENENVLQMIIHTPILAGLGKQVFFGSSTNVGITSLRAIAHADLRKTRLLAPLMWSKTQLDALYTGGKREGLKMNGSDTKQLIIYAIVAAIVIGSLGLVVYLLLNGGAPA